MSRLALGLLTLSMAFALPAHAEESDDPAETAEFAGRYSGNSFETAMGMVIREDGTFEWRLSVGSLDMRAAGTWSEENGRIVLVSDPIPVPPEFGWSGMETTPDGPLLRIVWAGDGRPFQYASVTATCSNGNIVYGQVYEEGWSPDGEECDAVETVKLRESTYEVTSQTYDLTSTFAPAEGETIRFEFHRNDLGVADFTGMSGALEDGVLKLSGGQWPLEMRKVVAE